MTPAWHKGLAHVAVLWRLWGGPVLRGCPLFFAPMARRAARGCGALAALAVRWVGCGGCDAFADSRGVLPGRLRGLRPCARRTGCGRGGNLVLGGRGGTRPSRDADGGEPVPPYTAIPFLFLRVFVSSCETPLPRFRFPTTATG